MSLLVCTTPFASNLYRYTPLAKLVALNSMVLVPAGRISFTNSRTFLPRTSKTVSLVKVDLSSSNSIVVVGLKGFG